MKIFESLEKEGTFFTDNPFIQTALSGLETSLQPLTVFLAHSAGFDQRWIAGDVLATGLAIAQRRRPKMNPKKIFIERDAAGLLSREIVQAKDDSFIPPAISSLTIGEADTNTLIRASEMKMKQLKKQLILGRFKLAFLDLNGDRRSSPEEVSDQEAIFFAEKLLQESKVTFPR